MRFHIWIDPKSKTVASVRFRSNGCGFMIAAADVLADTIRGKRLGGLHGLDENELRQMIGLELDLFPPGRSHCETACIEALRAAFADYRSFQIEEFQGEKALICTCFGVSEETIESFVKRKAINTVEEVTRICDAGGGCGSCRMLIQEIIDVNLRGNTDHKVSVSINRV